MIRYECDRCGASMGANDSRRFIVKLEVYAAAGHIDLDAEAGENVRHELDAVVRSLAQADPDEVEDKTYRCLRFDVCDDCRRTLLLRPLA